MFDDGWREMFTEWVDVLLERVDPEAGGIRLGDAAKELRATSLSRSLDSLDDDDLAHMIDDNATMVEGFGVLGWRDGQDTLVDPANATLTTTAAILHRRKFSHRIMAADVANRVLPLEGPLGVLDFDIAGRDQLSDIQGNSLDRFASAGNNFAVPEWVDGFDAGRLMVSWREGDQVHFEVVDDGDIATDGAAEWHAIAARIQESATRGVGADLNRIMFDQIRQDTSLFRATTPPIDELLHENGFNNRGEWWGPADQHWKTPGEAARASRIALASQTYGLQHHAQQALIRLNEIWRDWSAFHTFGIGEPPRSI